MQKYGVRRPAPMFNAGARLRMGGPGAGFVAKLRVGRAMPCGPPSLEPRLRPRCRRTSAPDARPAVPAPHLWSAPQSPPELPNKCPTSLESGQLWRSSACRCCFSHVCRNWPKSAVFVVHDTAPWVCMSCKNGAALRDPCLWRACAGRATDRARCRPFFALAAGASRRSLLPMQLRRRRGR